MTARLRRHPAVAGLLAAVLLLTAVWAVNVVQIARSVEARAEYWSEPRGQSGGLLYVALGDSTAQGIGASSPDKGYVAVIAQRLRESTGRPVEVVNLSRSGARIDDVLDRQLPALSARAREPDVVTVGIGGNDVRDYDPQTFAEQADRLTAALPDGAYVADAPYFMHGRSQRDAEQAADALRRGAASRELEPVALQATMRAQGWQAMFTQFAADWFHPNDRGHRVWADAFWQKISGDVQDLKRRPR